MKNPIEYWEAELPKLIETRKQSAQRGSLHDSHVVAAQLAGAKIYKGYIESLEVHHEREDHPMY